MEKMKRLLAPEYSALSSRERKRMRLYRETRGWSMLGHSGKLYHFWFSGPVRPGSWGLQVKEGKAWRPISRFFDRRKDVLHYIAAEESSHV